MNPLIRNVILLLSILVAAACAIAFKPTIRLAEGKPEIKLEEAIPKEFGDWKWDSQGVTMVVNPQQQDFLNTLYSQTLSRTYVHKSGRRIMLSLAYGSDQSHDTQIHKPEVCYPAQGFRLVGNYKDSIQLQATDIPVMRVITELGQRHEPVTYWIRIGDKIARGSVEQNFARIGIGLHGYIPDGMLFRVSEISKNNADSFLFQDNFVKDLLTDVAPEIRLFLVGIYANSI